MRITDYEGGRTLRDIAITLTRSEAEELAGYLNRLVGRSEVKQAHLCSVTGTSLDQELTVAIDASEMGVLKLRPPSSLGGRPSVPNVTSA